MNRGMYGFALPPNFGTRVAPPRWVNCRPYVKSGTYNNFVVPANVYQIMVCVWGAGGGGARANGYNSQYARGGDGGGYAQGIIDVVPGQVLPTITVGAGGAGVTGTSSGADGSAGGTSSFGTLLTATGGAGGIRNSTSAGTPGTGTASATLRQAYTATGGYGGYAGNSTSASQGTGGGGAGSIYGTGGNGGPAGASLSSNHLYLY